MGLFCVGAGICDVYKPVGNTRPVLHIYTGFCVVHVEDRFVHRISERCQQVRDMP